MIEKYIELSRSLENGVAKIDSDGEIPAATHKEIYQALNAIVTNTNSEKYGDYLRSSIEIACVHKVLYIAHEQPSIFNKISDLLYKGQKVIDDLATEEEREELENINYNFPTELEDLTDEGEQNLIVSYVGWACVAAINSILYGMEYDPVGIPETQSDPDNWTAAYYSSVAFSGGDAWESSGDKLKRKEFWIWYLSELIPNLFES